VDVEIARKKAVAAQAAIFDDTVSKAADQPGGFERSLAAAQALADAGGVDRLAKHLEDKNLFASRAAAIALAERGYVCSVPGLVEIADNAEEALVRRAVVFLHDFTGVAIENEDRHAVARHAAEWWQKNQPEDRFARRRTPR
jgi:hypothetical protein